MNKVQLLSTILASFLLAVSVWVLGYELTQDQALTIIITFSVGFVGYLLLLRAAQQAKSISAYILLAVILRLLLVFAFPNLSDDIYRFLWDGQLIHDGIHPLSYKPADLVAEGQLSSWYTDIFPKLNSPDYYTVYPPLSQLVFYLSTLSDTWSWAFSSMVMKLILLIGELLAATMIYKLLQHFKISTWWLLVYLLNPLMIIELMGQMHYEGLMVAFLASALWSCQRKSFVTAGALFSGAVAVKLLPLMFLPLMMKYTHGKGQLLRFLGGFTVVSAILFLPFLFSLDLLHFLDSINLYFQSFEFNASIYYLLRQLGWWITGYNQIAVIGPLLSLISLWAILKISLGSQVSDLQAVVKKMFYCFAIYLFLTTTVHPWYLTMLLFLAVFQKKWWPVVWTGVVIWSYTTYSTPNFIQNLPLMALEYIVVFGVMYWEYRNQIKCE